MYKHFAYFLYGDPTLALDQSLSIFVSLKDLKSEIQAILRPYN